MVKFVQGSKIYQFVQCSRNLQKIEMHHTNLMCISKKTKSSQCKRLKMLMVPTIEFEPPRCLCYSTEQKIQTSQGQVPLRAKTIVEELLHLQVMNCKSAKSF